MSNNNYFTIAFKILTYLRHCYENGEQPNPDVLQATTFNISQEQYLNTLEMLKDDGYIKGIQFVIGIDGRIPTNINNYKITSSGLQYLEENSMMKKAYKALKEAREWLPFIK